MNISNGSVERCEETSLECSLLILLFIFHFLSHSHAFSHTHTLSLSPKRTDFNWYEPQFEISICCRFTDFTFIFILIFVFHLKSLYRTMNWTLRAYLCYLPDTISGFSCRISGRAAASRAHIPSDSTSTFWFNFLNFHRMIFELCTYYIYTSIHRIYILLRVCKKL